jgi:hypothetical protein
LLSGEIYTHSHTHQCWVPRKETWNENAWREGIFIKGIVAKLQRIHWPNRHVKWSKLLHALTCNFTFSSSPYSSSILSSITCVVCWV